MLKFILKEETAEKVVYEYFPEGGTEAGIVSYDKETNKCSIITLPKTDKHQIYAQKMFSKIRKYASINSFERKGTVAWY